MKIILLLLCHLTLVGCVTSPPVSFKHLSPDQSILVRYSSSGCFHNTYYDFEFRRNATLTAKVSGRTPLGTVTVSDHDAAGLDRLLAFYGRPNLGGCTTVDHISVSLHERDRVVFTKSYTDASCDTYDMKGITTFSSIAAKLKSKRP